MDEADSGLREEASWCQVSRTEDNRNMGRIYPTRVDWWIGLILIFTVAVMIGSAVPCFIGPAAQTPVGLGIGILCLTLAVWTGWIPFNTNYEVGQTELVIRSAGFKWRVSLDSIVEVFPTHNPLSSPACSLDRLRVNYRNRKGRLKFVLISPREKEEFLRDLVEAVPGSKRIDDRLVNKGIDAI
jgi:Bacterial PH domain